MSDLKKGLTYYFGKGLTDKPCYFSPEQIVKFCEEGRFLVFTASVIYRRKALIEAGKYPQDLRWHSDWLAFFASAFRYGMCFTPEILSEFQILSEGFSGRGMRNPVEQRAVLTAILKLLDQKEYADVVPRIRDSYMLAPFGKTMLRLILTNKQYWRKYGSFSYLRHAIWWTVRIEAKKVLPSFLTAFYFWLTGHGRAPQNTAPTA